MIARRRHLELIAGRRREVGNIEVLGGRRHSGERRGSGLSIFDTVGFGV